MSNMIPNFKFDSVNVAVPGQRHFPIAIAEIQSGNHI